MNRNDTIERSIRFCGCNCGESVEGRRTYFSDACKQRAYRRRKDPGIGSPERKKAQDDALYEHRIALEIRADMKERGLLGSAHPAYSNPEPSRRAQHFESQPPWFANNPVYEDFEQEYLLYNGLVVTGLTSAVGETRYVTKTLRVKVSNKIDLGRDWDSHRKEIAQSSLHVPDGPLWTKPSIVNGVTHGNPKGSNDAAAVLKSDDASTAHRHEHRRGSYAPRLGLPHGRRAPRAAVRGTELNHVRRTTVRTVMSGTISRDLHSPRQETATRS